MKKLGLFALVGLLTGGVYVAAMDIDPVTPYRIAIADRACPSEGEAGYNYLRSKCAWWKSRGDYCACATQDPELLTGELADLSTLPDALFRKLVVCDHTDTDPETGIERDAQTVHFAKLNTTPPLGWTCAVICPRLWRRSSMRNISGDLEACLAEVCDPCVITPDSWGPCPRCAANGTCAEVCQ